MFGGTVIAAGWQVVGDHGADRFGPFPADISFMATRNQRQPVSARLASGSRAAAPDVQPGAGTRAGGGFGTASRRHACLTIGIGAAVDRILNDPMDGGIIGPSPRDIAIADFYRQVQPVFEEPQQGLTSAAKFL